MFHPEHFLEVQQHCSDVSYSTETLGLNQSFCEYGQAIFLFQLSMHSTPTGMLISYAVHTFSD